MKRTLLILPLLLVLLSCKKDVLRGEGNISTQNRSLEIEDGFNAIKVNGATTVIITSGEEKSLSVRGYGNLLNAYHSEVINGVLILGYKDNMNIKNDNIEVFITYPRLPDIELNGNCKAICQGVFPLNNEIDATINGNGSIFYERCNSNIVNININGSGKIDGNSISTLEANVKINGSGEVKVEAVDKLKVNINGSGKVYYKGNPVIETNISGSGKIIALN